MDLKSEPKLFFQDHLIYQPLKTQEFSPTGEKVTINPEKNYIPISENLKEYPLYLRVKPYANTQLSLYIGYSVPYLTIEEFHTADPLKNPNINTEIIVFENQHNKKQICFKWEKITDNEIELTRLEPVVK